MKCIFCNSSSHIKERCNSRMNGQRGGLLDQMSSIECPDFKNNTIAELRFMAHYTQTTPTIEKDKEYLLCQQVPPIALTLSKTRTIRELIARWELLGQARTNYYSRPEDEDCPICLEKMTVYRWDYMKGIWEKRNVLQPGETVKPQIETSCGHTFCGKCWEMHMTKNAVYCLGQAHIKCPYCRTLLVRRASSNTPQVVSA